MNKFPLTHIFVAVITVFSVFASDLSADAKVVIARDTLTIRKVFTNLPLDVLEIIPRSTRLDMLDYLEHGEMKPVRNSMNGMSTIVAPVSDSLLNVDVTSSSRLTIRLLPVKKGDLAACISTLGSDTQARDSEIRFFNEDMQMQKSSRYFPDLRLEDFLDFTDVASSDRKELLSLVPFPTVELKFDSESTSITARLSVGTFMGEEDFARLKPHIRDRKLIWTGSRYQLLPAMLPATYFPPTPVLPPISN